MEYRNKIILLGVGNFGKKILNVLHKINKYDIEIYDSNILYKSINLDNVEWCFIATPNYMHYEQALFFLTKGINTFLEKPGTLSYDSLNNLIELSNKKNVKFYIDDVLSYEKVDLSNKKFIYKKYSNSKSGNVIDKICYHHIYLLYNDNTDYNININNVEYANRYEAKFSIILNNEEYNFDYSLSEKNKEKIHNIMIDSDEDALYNMIKLVLDDNVIYELNHKKSLFATKITREIKNRLYDNVAVVGGGIYGITSAIKLSDSGYNVTLYEKKHRLCDSASGINQYRVHRGYHYPRSQETINNCKNDEPDFKKFFLESIVKPKVKHYYAISKENSLVTAEEYKKVLNENNLDWIDEGTYNECDLLISVDEELYNPNILRDMSYVRLYGCGVDVRTNTEWKKEYIANYNKIVYATYANLNNVTGENFEYQFELCEKPIVELPDEYKDLSIVIMDGPFMCFDPYCDTKYHLAGNVVHAIHSTNIGKHPIIPSEFIDYIDNGIIFNPKNSRFPRFIESAKKYFPNIEKTKHIGSMFTIRTVLPYQDATDTRPSIVRKINDNEYVVFSGKIVNCVYSANKLLEIF